MSFLSYTGRLILFSGILALILFAAGFMPGSVLHAGVWYILAFFTGITLLLHGLSSFAFRKSNMVFMTATFGSVALKLFFCLAFLFGYLFYNPSEMLSFVLNFFVLYFLFTAFEIYTLLHNLRAQKKAKKSLN